MELSDYFNFLTPNDIRLKNSRIGIETILYEYIYRARTPEEIAQIYTTLTLEQVYATILYYLNNQEAVNQYMASWLEHCLKGEEEQDKNPPHFVQRIRQLRREKEAVKEIIKNDYSISLG